jgi:hypothetical protein
MDPLVRQGTETARVAARKVYGDVPVLIMEGDIVDISSYNEADTHNRIDAFVETLSAKTGR